MHKKNFKGRSSKRNIDKCVGVCRTYTDIAYAYSDKLAANSEIVEFRVNVPMEGNEYVTDFVATKSNGEIMVRECLPRHHLEYVKTCRLLELSRQYWLHRGITDWGLVIDAKE